MRITVTVEAAGQEADVLLDCDDQTTAADLGRSLADTLPGSSAELRLAGRSVDSDAVVADLGLRDGQRIGLGQEPPPVPEPPSAGWVLEVVSGPESGRVFALPIGEHVLGRSGPLSVADFSLSRQHCRITVGADGTAGVTDLGSSNGTRLDGVALAPDQPTPIGLGQLLGVGHSVVVIRPARRPDAATEPAEPGFVHFLRPPRLLPHRQQARVEIPRPPQEKPARRIPWIAIAMPLLFGGVMAVLMGPRYLLFALMSPLMMAANYFSEQRSGAKDHRHERVRYHEQLEAAQRRLSGLVAAEQERRRDELADAAETFLTCVLPGRRLWERRRHDEDQLLLRVGTADLPATVEITGDTEGQPERRLHGVPVGVPLGEAGVVGVAGPHDAVAGLLRWLVVQLCAYHPTRDLELTLITAPGESHWQWVRWLPHLRPDDEDVQLAHVGNDRESIAARISALVALLAARKEAVQGRSGMASAFPAHVVVVHGYRDVRTVVGLAQLLDEGPDYGIYAICSDAEERLLPERCTATVLYSAERPDFGSVRRTGRPAIEDVLLEGVAPAWCERVARAISPLIDVGGDSEDSTLPESARLLDVIGLDPPDPDAIRARWALEPRSTTMTLGVGLDGAFGLDLRRDGPHGLVAGTTGSGKTELLQTMIASLAVVNRPDELNFVLVDYKGDSAFKDCVRLPHTVGKVNDLDPHLVERALESLSAELRFREHFLAEAQVKDIEDYQLLRASEPERAPMPRLVLVIDEFAALVKELPEFVTGLVGIAQRGRSLGIHLVLATQRPSGVVSPEIRANTNLRIALRVTDAGDSADVIGGPDASAISKSTPGRAYARTGAGTLQAFQSGRVGGRRPGAAAVEVRPPVAVPVGWTRLGHPVPRLDPGEERDDVADTDLAGLVEAVVHAGRAERVPEQRQPWLPALPDRLTLDDVLAEFPDAVPSADRLVIPFGLVDLPSEQRRDTASFDLARGGHLGIISAPRAGRSTVLRAIAGAVGAFLSPADVHLYGVDCGNNALLPLAGLPHTGAVVTREQTDRMARLVARLREVIAERQRQLAAAGFADVAEQRDNVGPEERLPYVLVLLDRWEGFFQTYDGLDGGRLVTAWQQILQEGTGAGVKVVMTGDRTLTTGRMATLLDDKLMMRMVDPGDFSVIGLSSRQVPATLADGRGFRAEGARETQVALLDPDPAGAAQVNALQHVVAAASEAATSMPTKALPFRIDVLPASIGLVEAERLTGPVPTSSFLVAVGGDTLGGLVLDAHEHGPGLLVTGPRRSGRSTVLRTLGTVALRSGWQVLAVTPRVSPLRELDGVPGFHGAVGLGSDESEVKQLVDRLLASDGPLLTLVDDVELLGSDGWLPTMLAGLLERIRDTGSVLAAAGTPAEMNGLYRGPVGPLKQSGSGVMLSPQSNTDLELFSATLPRSVLGQSLPPGSGYLMRSGLEPERVQVIWPG